MRVTSCFIEQGSPTRAIRTGHFKLLEFFEDKRIKLYNLKIDPGEKNNLAKTAPELAKQLHEELQQWQTALNAPCPSEPNPNYDPSTVKKKERNQRGKGDNKK